MSAETNETEATRPGEPLPTPTENAGRIAGLHAWIGDVDRRMGVRTKLFLALAAIAIGAAGAAIFLAVEANRTSADQEQLNELEARVDRLEDQLEEVAEARAVGPEVPPEPGGSIEPGPGPDDGEEPEPGALDPDDPTSDTGEPGAAPDAPDPGSGGGISGVEPSAPDGEPQADDIDPDAGPPMPEIATHGE